jgi:UDP-N-acetylglucosamine pyrophosphorylase
MLQTTDVDCHREITDTERKNSTGTLIMHDTSCLAYAKEIPSLHVQKSRIHKI